MNSIIKGIYGKIIFSKYKKNNTLNLILPDIDYELNQYAILNCKNIMNENKLDNTYIYTNKENEKNIEKFLHKKDLNYKIIVLKEKELENLICLYLLKCNSMGKCTIKSMRLVSMKKNYAEIYEIYEKIKIDKENIVNLMMNRFEF